MPFDKLGSDLEGKIAKLEKWINALHNAKTDEPIPNIVNRFTPAIKNELLVHLIGERDFLQRQLGMHRRRDEELGIKY